VRRAGTARLLILAFLALLVAPAHAGWVCPDGTPCGERVLQVAACAAHPAPDEPSCCKGGSGVETASGAVLSAASLCRFSLAPESQPVAPTAESRLAVDAPAAPAPGREWMPEALRVLAGFPEFTPGYRPPPLAPAAPSRAPPAP
jgi:hypothetical protein